MPHDPHSYYRQRELVPEDLARDLDKARIVITNYHAFKLRETMDVSKTGRAFLQGRGEPIRTIESEGQMIRRVMPQLMNVKNVMVLNDEAHHCYREKPGDHEAEFADLQGDDKKEAKEEAKRSAVAARLWISGLEAVQRELGIARVIDLSATPFFLKGSGYVEGTLFPWTASDFSLMDAIECGIVKLPRVPIADNIPEADMPRFRDLWNHIGKKMPKGGRGKTKKLDPLSIPVELQTALDALFGHYKETFELWQREGIRVPPCFILVCNNTSTSKLLYDYISGFFRELDDGSSVLENGRLDLFRNYDEHGNPYPKPRTILVDSHQLESGESLDDNFRTIAADEIERFRRELVERSGDPRSGEKLSDQELLREVMNTVGKPGRLGESVRCVVSVSMLTEGWDANTVTHILGVRAFGTQLLCEQVIGRALRRQCYDLNEEGLFPVEYADILGIPFDFTAKPTVSKPQPPRDTILVEAVRPERDHLEIGFPNVVGYRVDLPREDLRATFNNDSVLTLTKDLVGPTITTNAGLIGETVNLDLEHLSDVRKSTLMLHLSKRLIYNKFRDAGDVAEIHLFPAVKRIVRQWLDNCLVCKEDTFPAQLMYQELADMACERIAGAITRAHSGERPIKAIVDPYNPMGSTRYVHFTTSNPQRWETDPNRSHINWAILDSDWEREFCAVAESHTHVRAYAKNHNLGFYVPYVFGSEARRYIPDFLLLVEDGHGEDDLLNLIVEIKGFRAEDAKIKRETMENYWVPGVNALKTFGRWAFVELSDVWTMKSEFRELIEDAINRTVASQTEILSE